MGCEQNRPEEISFSDYIIEPLKFQLQQHQLF